MEIIQEIGSYAGFAAVLGLAVLSALYFSQARDVKRLREWAGRSPERPPVPTQTQRVVAQPIAKPAQTPAGSPPPVPRPPGAPGPATGQPGIGASAPAQAAAAGAAPAIARGPAPATPAAASSAGSGSDAHGTAVHPAPEPPEGDEHEGTGSGDEEALGTDADTGADTTEPASDVEPTADPGAGLGAADGEREDDESHSGEDGESDAEKEPADAERPGEDEELSTDDESPADDEGPETGEWSPEDEHSDIDFTDEHDVVPATPAAAVPRPPQPPRPFPRRATPATSAAYARGDRGPILPRYAESRPAPEEGSSSTGSSRTLLVAVAAVVVLALGVFAALQLTGGDDPEPASNDAGLSAADPDDRSGDGGSRQPAIDPSQVTVAVLNGTTVPGLAATIGDTISGAGFQLGTVTNNFDQERAESVVFYAPGAEREAAAVGRQLDISQREAIDADSQALAGDATVVVVAGADQNQ